MPAATPSSDPWIADAARALETFTAACAPPLRRRLEPVIARLARNNGGSSLAEALTRPSATPFVPLIDAVAADLGLTGDPRVGSIGTATVFLYAYVRVQDDLVDEPRRVARAQVYVAEALLGEHLAAMGAAVTDPRLWAWRTRVMHRFTEVATREVDDRRSPPATYDGDLRWMGEKFLPMAVPLVGLALAAGRCDDVERLVELTVDLGLALQMVNDLYNADEDAAAGRGTPVLAWLGPCEGGRKVTLIGHPALDRAMDVARGALEEARRRTGDLPATRALVERVAGMVEAAPRGLLRLTLGMAA